MVALVTRDSKKQNRNLDITGFVKPSGTKVARCKNDKKKTYFVEVKANGTTSCYTWAKVKGTGRIVKVQCLGHKHTGHCYHTDAVKNTDLPTYEQVNAGLEINALLLKNRELYRSGALNEAGELTAVDAIVPAQSTYNIFSQEDAYEQIATVTKCPVCHKVDAYYNKTGKCGWESQPGYCYSA